MTWGTVTIGGIAFREELSVAETGDGKVTVKGQDSTPPQELAAVLAAHRNVLALAGSPLVPVTFTDKAGLTGFYRVDEASSDLFHFAGGAVVTASWQVVLVRLGTERDVEFESRVPTIARLTDLTAEVPEFWHAPPAGVLDYYTGVTVPASSTLRDSQDGPVTVYRGLPDDAVPRWTVPAASYMAGSARIRLDGIRRAGLDTPAHTQWELSNALVRAQGKASGAVEVAAWEGDRWVAASGFQVTVNGAPVTTTPELTILRNDPEQATVRLSWPVGTGRLVADLSLRRGSRFVSVLVKRHAAATLGVFRSEVDGCQTFTGGVWNGGTGTRWVLGSSKTVTADTVNGGISLSTAGRELDVFIGHEVGGTAAQAGDTRGALLDQYLGTTGETVRGVRR